MKTTIVLTACILLGSLTGAMADEASRMPISEITLAGLKLGVTVDDYKKSNPKAVFKPVTKDGLLHHLEFIKEESKGQDRTKLVLQADPSGHIYWIKYIRFYPT